MSRWDLYLSLGNSSVQWGASVGERWELTGREPPAPQEALEGVLRAAEGRGLDRASLGGVAGCLSAPDAGPWRQAAQAVLGRPLLLLGDDLPAGVPTAYAAPTQWGADRAAAARGALERGLAPCLILDAGTCLTADLLSPQRGHLGGAIAPGLPALRAGIRAAAPHLEPALPTLPLEAGSLEPGRDTAASLALGLRLALQGTAHSMVAALVQMTEPPAQVILTGGDADLLATLLPAGAQVLPLLTLEGVRAAHRESARERAAE